MVCFSVILSQYRITCLWFCNKRLCNKKGALFVLDRVYDRRERRLTGKAGQSVRNALSASAKHFWPWEFCPLSGSLGNGASEWALASFPPYTREQAGRERVPSEYEHSLRWVIFAVMTANIHTECSLCLRICSSFFSSINSFNPCNDSNK